MQFPCPKSKLEPGSPWAPWAPWVPMVPHGPHRSPRPQRVPPPPPLNSIIRSAAASPCSNNRILIRRQGGHRESHRGPRLMHIHDGSSQGSGWIKNFMFHIKRSFSHVLKPFHEGSRYGSRWIKINRLAENVASSGFKTFQ